MSHRQLHGRLHWVLISGPAYGCQSLVVKVRKMPSRTTIVQRQWDLRSVGNRKCPMQNASTFLLIPDPMRSRYKVKRLVGSGISQRAAAARSQTVWRWLVNLSFQPWARAASSRAGGEGGP